MKWHTAAAKRETKGGDHHVGEGRDVRADGEDQVAIARRQHDQSLGVCLDGGKPDVGDVGAHDQPDEHDEQVGAVRTAARAAR